MWSSPVFIAEIRGDEVWGSILGRVTHPSVVFPIKGWRMFLSCVLPGEHILLNFRRLCLMNYSQFIVSLDFFRQQECSLAELVSNGIPRTAICWMGPCVTSYRMCVSELCQVDSVLTVSLPMWVETLAWEARSCDLFQCVLRCSLYDSLDVRWLTCMILVILFSALCRLILVRESLQRRVEMKGKITWSCRVFRTLDFIEGSKSN